MIWYVFVLYIGSFWKIAWLLEKKNLTWQRVLFLLAVSGLSFKMKNKSVYALHNSPEAIL